MTAMTPSARCPLSMLSVRTEQCPPRRAVELEGAFLGGARGGGGQQLVDGLRGERVAVAAAHERDGPAVAEDELAVFVADDHGLGERVEDPTQADGVCARFGDRLGGVLQSRVRRDRARPRAVWGLWATGQHRAGRRGRRVSA